MDLLLKKELQMMNQQARQYLAQSPSHLPLRWYGPNSPRARGRLVAVAMLADGQLNPAELHEIAEGVVATTVGLDRRQFIQVLFDLCEDIEKKLKPNGRELLDKDILDQLLSEVSNPYIRHSTLNAINLAVSCDEKICSDEAKFLSRATEAWGLPAYTQTEVFASTYVWLRPWEG
jgi:hypothetical protein